MSGLLTFVGIIIIIVGFHESAHFVFMKLFGVKVLRFSIGFGPVLFSKKIGETEYQIAAIPLGGYVLPLSAAMNKHKEYSEYIEPDHPEKYFESKPPWQRMVTYLVGPLSNLFFAFVLYLFLFTCIGLPHPTTVIGIVQDNYPAQKAGIMVGDKVESINGVRIGSWDEVGKNIQKSDGGTMRFGVLRGETRMEFLLTPVKESQNGESFYRTGIGPVNEYLTMSPKDALKEAVNDTVGAVGAYANFFKQLFTGRADKKSFGGPIMIYQLTSQSAKQGWIAIIGLMIMINMSLFAFNMLPIPMLDGGQIYPALFEMVTGIKLDEKFYAVWQMIGAVILGLIFLMAMWNDISRIFG